MTDNNTTVAGIDCALEKHQYQLASATGAVLAKGSIANSLAGGELLCKQLERHAAKDNVIIGIEATNTYHLCLQHFLAGKGYKVIVINPMKTSAYTKIDDYGNKTDAIDANGICSFLLDGKHRTIKQMNQKYLKLRELCRCLTKLQADLVRTALRLHSRLLVINPEFTQYFSETFSDSGLYILEKYPTPLQLAEAKEDELQQALDKIANGFGKPDTAQRIIGLAIESFGVTADTEGYLRYIQHHLDAYRFLREKVREIKKEIRAEARKEYCCKEIETISSIRGVGTEIAAGILAELGDIRNFSKVSSIVRFAGMIVLRHSSGKTEGTSRMSKQGSRYLRCYLHQAAMGAKLHSVTFAAIYAQRNMKIKDLDPQSKKIARAKVRGCLARRMLETIALCLMKGRKFNDKIAFDAIELDD